MKYRKNKYGKIPLPWKDTSKEESRLRVFNTQQFWRISREWNGRSPGSLTIQQSLQEMKTIVSQSPTAAPVAQRAHELQNDIICFGSKSAQRKHEIKNRYESKPAKMIIL